MLNIGLQAGILDTRTFSMFVVHAIILTFMTTPITILVYPQRFRVHAGVVKEKIAGSADEAAISERPSGEEFKSKFAVVLDKIEQLPAAMTIMQLLQNPSAPSSALSGASESSFDDKGTVGTIVPELKKTAIAPPSPRISIDALRLIELTDRTSAVLKSQAADSLIHSDPVVSIFRTYGHLSGMNVSAALNVIPYDEFSSSISNHVRDFNCQMLIVPWCRGQGAVEEGTSASVSASNPFDGIFKSAGQTQTASVVYSNFIRKVFLDATTDVALFVDRGISTSGQSARQHIFLPFFGGPDDRLALSFVVQLCANPLITATVVKIQKAASPELAPIDTIEEEKAQAFAVTNVSAYSAHLQIFLLTVSTIRI